MTTRDVAHRYNELAKLGKFDLIQDELFSTDCESVEPIHSKWLQSVKGLEAIKKKGAAFNSLIEIVHSSYCGSPVIAGHYFSLEMGMDITFKDGIRLDLDEICLFQVKDGKVISEQFFY